MFCQAHALQGPKQLKLNGAHPVEANHPPLQLKSRENHYHQLSISGVGDGEGLTPCLTLKSRENHYLKLLAKSHFL